MSDRAEKAWRKRAGPFLLLKTIRKFNLFLTLFIAIGAILQLPPGPARSLGIPPRHRVRFASQKVGTACPPLLGSASSARPLRNLMQALLALFVLLALLALPRTSFAQTLSGFTATGLGAAPHATVTLSAPAPAVGTVVALSSSDPRITLPATVTVAGGAASATVPVMTSATTNLSATLSASYNAVTLTAKISFVFLAPTTGLSSVDVSPASFVGGNAAAGSVQVLGMQPGSSVVVSLSSSSPAVVVPASVTVSAGGTAGSVRSPNLTSGMNVTAPFPVTTTAVSASTFVTVTATTAGARQTTALTVNPSVLTSIAVSPASATLATGGTQTFTAVAKDQNGTALITQPAFTWASTGVGTVSSAGVYSAGSTAGTATVTATSGTVSGGAAVTVNPASTFKLSSYPSRLTVIQGLSSAATVSVIPTGSFSTGVTLTNSPLPAGVTLAYGTNPTSGASVVTFTATATATLGTTPITIIGTSGSLVNTLVIPLTVAPVVSGSSANFNLAFGTGQVNLTAGTPAGGSAVLTVTPVNGFTGPVALTVIGLPIGVTVTLGPPSLTIAGTSPQGTTATFQATSAVTPGYYAVSITGSGDGGATGTGVIGLNILPPANTLPFTLTVTDNSTNAIPTGQASAVVSLATTAGYSNPITLSVVDDPSAPVLAPVNTTGPTKIGVSFSKATLSISGTSALTLIVGASVASGAYHFVVAGLSTDNLVQRAAFTVFVAPDGAANSDLSIDGSRPSQAYTGDSPTYPLAAGAGDMQRFDFDSGNIFEIGSSGHAATGAAPLSLNSNNAPIPNNSPIGGNGLPDGTDDRKYVASTIPPPYTYPYRACVRIKAFWTSTSFACGSGTLIGKNHILTAAHVIFDPAQGGMAKTIYIMPGYDYNWSQTHALTYTTANHAFVAKGYLKGAKFGYPNSYDYDDWAVIDCNPISNGPPGQHGGPVGNFVQYMQLDNTDNVTFPEINTHIAGYPAFTWPPATPVLTGTVPGFCPDLFETYVYNGDDGAVNLSPEPNVINDSPDLLFSTMDISHGDSGAGLWYFTDTDNVYHLYGVVDAIAPWSGPFGITSGWTGVHAQITGTRYSIIKTNEKLDGDEPPAVYLP